MVHFITDYCKKDFKKSEIRYRGTRQTGREFVSLLDLLTAREIENKLSGLKSFYPDTFCTYSSTAEDLLC